MSDFVHDLEVELLAAAHRRALAGDRRWPRRRAVPSRPPAAARRRWRAARRIIAHAGRVAALFAVLAAVVALRPRAGVDERPVTGPAGTARSGALALPAAELARPCGTAAVALPATPPPAALTSVLGVLRRPASPADPLPKPPQPLSTWLPVGDYDPGAVRRPAQALGVVRRISSGEWRTTETAPGYEVHVVPTGDLRTSPLACGGGGGASRGPGACVVAGAAGATPQWRCFTLAEIRAGRAFALFGQTLVGLEPDGPDRVAIAAGNLPPLGVSDNVVERGVPALHPGDRIAPSASAQTPVVLVLNPTPVAARAEQAAATVRARVHATTYAAKLDYGAPQQDTTVYAVQPGSDAIAGRVAGALEVKTVETLLPPPVPVLLDKTPDVVVILGRMR